MENILVTVNDTQEIVSLQVKSTADLENSVFSVFGRNGNIVASSGDYNSDQITEGSTNKYLSSADKTKLDGIESGATSDQTDEEIETAYNNQVEVVSQVDAEAGVSTDIKRWNPLRIAQAIAALSGGGGGGGDALEINSDGQVNTGTTFTNWYDRVYGDSGYSDLLSVFQHGNTSSVKVYDGFVAPWDCRLVRVDVVLPDPYIRSGSAQIYLGIGKHYKNPGTINSVTGASILLDSKYIPKGSYSYGRQVITSGFEDVVINAGDSVGWVHKGQSRRMIVQMTFRKE